MAASMKRGLNSQTVRFYSQYLLPRLVNMQTTDRIVKFALRSGLIKRKSYISCVSYGENDTNVEGRIGMSSLQQQQRNVIDMSDKLTSQPMQKNRLPSQHTWSLLVSSLLCHRQIINFHRLSRNLPQVRRFSSETGRDQENDNRQKSRRRMKLMDFQEIIWPSPFKTIRNYFFSFLISTYFDKTFSIKNFLNGAEQAVEYVSSCISHGNFDNLDGLVAHEAIREIRNNYADLDDNERESISVRSPDFYFKYVFEIGMIFDDDTTSFSSNRGWDCIPTNYMQKYCGHKDNSDYVQKIKLSPMNRIRGFKFVEITAVFQGFPGFEELQEESGPQYYQHVTEHQKKVYICNYRFIREFTKGVESDWTINKLNHFAPIDVPIDVPIRF